MTVATRFS